MMINAKISIDINIEKNAKYQLLYIVLISDQFEKLVSVHPLIRVTKKQFELMASSEWDWTLKSLDYKFDAQTTWPCCLQKKPTILKKKIFSQNKYENKRQERSTTANNKYHLSY